MPALLSRRSIGRLGFGTSVEGKSWGNPERLFLMIATSSSSHTVSPEPRSGPVAPPADIDASCRVPVMVLLACAAVWLVVASVFGLIASLKFHAPNLLAEDRKSVV